jgi:hypothetical protein
MSKGLTSLTFDERQQLLRLVIERITVENGAARIDTVLPPDQDNLRNRYPELVEGRADVQPMTDAECVVRPSAGGHRERVGLVGG